MLTLLYMIDNKIEVQIVLGMCRCVCFCLNLLKMNKVRGAGEGRREDVGGWGRRSWHPPVARAGLRCPGVSGGAGVVGGGEVEP